MCPAGDEGGRSAAAMGGDFSEEELAELIAALPPAPAAWVQAAAELPRARATIERLAQLAQEDAAARERIIADLESALRHAGVEPRRPLVERLRARLGKAGG
jgi:hypothetical protein